MSLDTSLLWSQEQLWKEVLCSSENLGCNNEHTCLQAMNSGTSMWLSSTVCCDIWPSSGTGNLLNMVIHINEFAHCEAGWIAPFQVSALITRMFLCTFFIVIGNTNTPGPILHLVVVNVKGKWLWVCVQVSTLLSLRNEGRRETVPCVHFIFFPRFSQQCPLQEQAKT